MEEKEKEREKEIGAGEERSEEMTMLQQETKRKGDQGRRNGLMEQMEK